MPDLETRPIRVGIALVEREGFYLIRRRPPAPGSPMPGYWEFPGGKCEPGESPEAATARECREEVGFLVRVGRLHRIIIHQYPHGLVELHYYHCIPEDSPAEPAPRTGFRWIPAGDLPSLRFPEANGPILDDLSRGAPPVEAG